MTQENQEGDLRERIENVIDQQINPSLLDHRGWIELVDIFPEERAITVRFRGECSMCMKIDDTLKEVVFLQSGKISERSGMWK